jgi:hypothetical protein
MRIDESRKHACTFRLSEQVRYLLAALAVHLGIGNKTAVIELAVREAAEKRRVKE